MDKLNVLISPKITEKTTPQVGKYSFVVALKSTKEDVKAALKSLYNVDVTSVRNSILPGKTKRIMSKRGKNYRTSRVKKATVMIKAGQKLDLFSQ